MKEKNPERKKAARLRIKLPKLNLWKAATLILLILVVGLWTKGCPTGEVVSISPEEIGKKTIEYINKNLVAPGTSASLVSVEETKAFYKVTTNYRGQDIPVYVTKDGRYIFLSQPLDMTQEIPREEEQKSVSCEDLPKRDKPKLMAFIVSYCPFGLQMQRVLNEIVKNIPEMAKYIEVRFMGSIEEGKITSMHGEKEATENLRQICIREEQSDKYWKYVDCFIKEGKSDECLDDAHVDRTKLQECMEDPSRGVEYAKEDFELQNKFRITGSPTLVLNDQRVNEYDFGGRSAEAVQTIICWGFTKQPEFCQQNLTTEQAARSFSKTYSGSTRTSGGQC